jgi:capsular polysaccharide biosynthesis protein
MEAKYGTPVTILRMETHDLETQISVLQHAQVAVGLHGSALVMALFMYGVRFPTGI